MEKLSKGVAVLVALVALTGCQSAERRHACELAKVEEIRSEAVWRECMDRAHAAMEHADSVSKQYRHCQPDAAWCPNESEVNEAHIEAVKASDACDRLSPAMHRDAAVRVALCQ